MCRSTDAPGTDGCENFGHALGRVPVTPSAAAVSHPAAVETILGRSLIYVTGKGGAGKTTVAAALGLAAATRGTRTIVADLTGSSSLAQAFRRPGDARAEPCLATGLWALLAI